MSTDATLPTVVQSDTDREATRALSLTPRRPPGEAPGYELIRWVGQGTFGQVWEATHRNTGRRVAIKFYLRRGGLDWAGLRREVDGLVRVDAGRGAVGVLDVGWQHDPPFLVMEWVEGGSLADRLRDGRTLPVADAVTMFEGILAVLTGCHSRGLLHCDLKPGNVLIDADGRPRLADFGQSRIADDQTPSLGTLFYMSPEQADVDVAPDVRHDIYAAGAIAHRMITGTAPHRDAAVMERMNAADGIRSRLKIYRQHLLAAGPPRRAGRVRGVDATLANIIDRCLDPDPDRRYGDVGSVRRALAARRRRRQRRPLWITGVLGPMVILAATATVFRRSLAATGRQTVAALRDEAAGANRMAAAYAGQSLETQLAAYFRAVETEAASEGLRERLTPIIGDASTPQDRRLTAIGNSATPAETRNGGPDRDRFLDAAPVQQLDEYLNRRLADLDTDDTPAATLFVTDRRGTTLAVAYRRPVGPAETSAGRNFAYRTYFHGGPADLPPDKIRIGEVAPVTQTHLSAPFRSTATDRWKVAVTAPIVDRGDVRGLVVATFNLGDLPLLNSPSDAQFATLIDAREGPTRGTVLDHPKLDDAPEERSYAIDPAALTRLTSSADAELRDPIVGDRYLVSASPVRLPAAAGMSSRRDAELLVLVQYQLDDVLEPAARLRRTLTIEAAAGLAGIVVITGCLLLFIRRLDRGGEATV